jgi:hypothetical protein
VEQGNGPSWELLELPSADRSSAELAALLTSLPLGEDDTAAAVGYAGEAFVARLLTQLPEYAGARIRWHNMDAESGLPYDIDVSSSGGELTYVEVKTTTVTRGFFDVSLAELEYARRHGERFHIYRVFPSAVGAAASQLAVSRICDPVAALTRGDARLVFLAELPKL